MTCAGAVSQSARAYNSFIYFSSQRSIKAMEVSDSDSADVYGAESRPALRVNVEGSDAEGDLCASGTQHASAFGAAAAAEGERQPTFQRPVLCQLAADSAVQEADVTFYRQLVAHANVDNRDNRVRYWHAITRTIDELRNYLDDSVAGEQAQEAYREALTKFLNGEHTFAQIRGALVSRDTTQNYHAALCTTLLAQFDGAWNTLFLDELNDDQQRLHGLLFYCMAYYRQYVAPERVSPDPGETVGYAPLYDGERPMPPDICVDEDSGEIVYNILCSNIPVEDMHTVPSEHAIAIGIRLASTHITDEQRNNIVAESPLFEFDPYEFVRAMQLWGENARQTASNRIGMFDYNNDVYQYVVMAMNNLTVA